MNGTNGHPDWRAVGRRLRSAWEGATAADRAILGRCRQPAEMLLEGAYWRLMDAAGVPEEHRERVAPVVQEVPQKGVPDLMT